MNRLWAEIDLDALKNNAEISARTVGKGVGIIAVVKAGAYGHGAVEISRVLEKLPSVRMLGISTVEEGLELRESGVSAPLLVLGVVHGGSVLEAVKNRLTLSVFTEDCLVSLSKAAKKYGKTVGCHLKVDTGMGRLGASKKDVFSLMTKARELDGLTLDGVFTHLAYSSAPQPEPTFEQINMFNSIVGRLESSGMRARFRHMANSAAIQRFSESFGNMVRPGIMLYGSSFQKDGLCPVMTVKTSVVRVRQMEARKPVGYGGSFVTKKKSVLATVPVGYKDGYFRSFSNTANVSIKGASAPVVGKVCMDFTTVDVTDIPGVKVGDEVVLFGDKNVRVEDLAQWADTVPYEIMTAIGGRISKKVFKSRI